MLFFLRKRALPKKITKGSCWTLVYFESVHAKSTPWTGFTQESGLGPEFNTKEFKLSKRSLTPALTPSSSSPELIWRAARRPRRRTTSRRLQLITSL